MEYIPAKTIVTKVKAPGNWFGIDYNMNIYKGCCHGCIYCDSRSDCYGVEDFDRVRAKEDALKIIRDDLRRKTRTGVVGTGAMSDPYNPFEKNLCFPATHWSCVMHLNSALPLQRKALCWRGTWIFCKVLVNIRLYF